MKRIIGEYAYPIIIIVGFCFLILISWFYSQLNIEDDSMFWSSVLPSAFVDVISLVISTILITKIIGRKKVYNEKNRLYKIIKLPHKRIIDYMMLEYIYLIKNKHANYYTKLFPKDNFMFENISPYFRENVHEDFQKDIIVIKKRYMEDTTDGVTSEYVKDAEVMRLKLMEDYQQNIHDAINKYMSEYSSILTIEYLIHLVEIKEKLNSNPLWVYSFFGDQDVMPVKIDIEKYIKSNQDYIDSILKLIRYFGDIDVQGIWDKENNHEWAIIGIGAGVLFTTYILVKVGIFLVGL